VTVPTELQFGNFDLAKDKYAWSLKLGGYVSTAPVTDIYYNTKGQSLGLKGGKALTTNEMRSGFYAMGEKAVWRGEHDPSKSLSLFGGVERALDTDEIARAQVYGGAVARGLVPFRPNDFISGEISYMDITSAELDYLHDARVKAGGQGWNKPNQIGMEFDYGAQLLPGVRLSPNISYVINPDNSQIPNTKFVPQDEFIFGLKLNFNLTTVLGMPNAPNLSD
jgi:porin